MPAEVPTQPMTTPNHDTDAPGHAGAVAHHSTDDHGDEHEHDDHAHDSPAMGSIDPMAWGAGVLGILLGLVVAAAFVMATSQIV